MSDPTTTDKIRHTDSRLLEAVTPLAQLAEHALRHNSQSLLEEVIKFALLLGICAGQERLKQQQRDATGLVPRFYEGGTIRTGSIPKDVTK